MNKFDVIVIGGGPGGYAAAVRASELGLRTALVEREKVGGICVHWGCIPTKTMLRYAKQIHLISLRKTYDFVYENITTDYGTAHSRSLEIAKRQGSRVEALLEKSQVALFIGDARLTGRTEIEIQPSGEKLFGKNIIIATGSRARQIPGVEYDEENIVTSREALQFSKAPSSAVVVGSGASGIEFATLWNRFGSKVTVLEMMPNILPNEDIDISIEAEAHFGKTGVQIRTGVKVESIVKTADGVEVMFAKGEKKEKLIVEKALISAGITPNSADLGLEELAVETNRGFIEISKQMQTNIPGIYAIGDVTGKLALAVVAAAQGIIAAEAIAGRNTQELIYENIPHCVYAETEVASVGLTEKQARERGYDIITVQNPITSNGRTLTLLENSGFIKLVADAKSKKLLGAHMIGGNVAELIGGPASMIVSGANMPKTADAVHAL